MTGPRFFPDPPHHAAAFRPVTRIVLIAVGLCLAGLVLIVVADGIVGPATNAELADALSRGG